MPSLKQRVRWCKGHMQVSMKMSKKILIAFIKKPSLQLFDSFIFVNSPSKSIIYMAGFTLTMFTSSRPVFGLSILLAMYNFIFVFGCDKWKSKFIIPHIFYSLTFNVIILYSMITFKDKSWTKTKHVKIS